jgi:hypothetical protein
MRMIAAASPHGKRRGDNSCAWDIVTAHFTSRVSHAFHADWPVMPSGIDLFASLLFGVVGLAAFRYGMKTTRWKPMVTGVALMVFPYFVDETWLMVTVGTALAASLFIFRD